MQRIKDVKLHRATKEVELSWLQSSIWWRRLDRVVCRLFEIMLHYFYGIDLSILMLCQYNCEKNLCLMRIYSLTWRNDEKCNGIGNNIQAFTKMRNTIVYQLKTQIDGTFKILSHKQESGQCERLFLPYISE